MIDTNELRRKVSSTDVVDHIDLHANIKPFLSELLDRLEKAEKSDAESIAMYRKARDERDALRAELSKQQALTDAAQHIAEVAQRRADALRAEIEELHALIAAVKKRADAEFRLRVKREEEYARLQAKIEAMGRPGAEWFDWLPQGTTHISKIKAATIPCFGLEARFNVFKYIDGVLYTYRTDSDNEYGEWVKTASRYRNDVLPTVYPLSGA